MTIPKKLNYLLQDIGRWVGHYEIGLTLPSYFPFDSKPLQLALVAAGQKGGDESLQKATDAVFQAVWGKGREVLSDEKLAAVLNEAGLDGNAIVAASHTPEAQKQLDENTQAAIQAGAFGSPSFVLEGQLFWGNDRLDFLEKALKA